MTALDIFIVRHGNTFDPGDTVTRVGGRTDLALSVSGQKQAADLARHFAQLVPSGFANAYCSSLQRTRQTAEAILAASHNAPAVQTLAFLKEIDYGPDENKPEADVVERLGERALQDWDEQAIPPPGWDVDPAILIASWRHFFAGLRPAETVRPVLVVTSNGIARFVLDALDDRGSEAIAIKLKTGAYGQVRIDEGRSRLISWGLRP